MIIAFFDTNVSLRAKWHFRIGKEWTEHRWICLLVVILTKTVPVQSQVICVLVSIYVLVISYRQMLTYDRRIPLPELDKRIDVRQA